MSNKFCYLIALFALVIASCNTRQTKDDTLKPIDWSNKEITTPLNDSLNFGSTYLSVYSQIYSYTEHTELDLTATVSIRNTDENQDSYLLRADYYDTHGKLIKSYLDSPIVMNQLETLEIVIAEFDKEGGTGGNFIFEWATKPNSPDPLFEGVMISTYGQQGLSITTQGKRIK
jgi:hypothetical protein